ncbi:MAG: GGDEF domain-containing protein [Actinomycetota bacterium]|nr:GGDEF domain-containing protein [Actinomycetota bacterium]
MRDGERSLTVAVADVADTPWRVILTAPTGALFAPAAQDEWAAWLLLAAFAVAGALAAVLFVRLTHARLAASSAARTDALTGLANRRAMEEHLARLAAQAMRHGHELVALAIDLDHFKSINDRFGHEGGDLALSHVAGRLQAALRAPDIAGRWGGEEFLVLLPDTDQTGGLIVAERIREAIAMDCGASPRISVTASIGLAVLDGDPARLLRNADSALYEAKISGRNRVVAARVPAPQPDPVLVGE